MEGEVNDKSFIKTALKHHSTVQEAIKVLQGQLNSLSQIRESTKQSFISDHENDLEKSTNDLLFTTSHFLQESPDNDKLRHSPVLSSTLKKQEEVKGDDVIRNLLPSFQQVSNIDKLKENRKEESLTKLADHNLSQLSSITPITKDSIASTTTSATPNFTSFNVSNASYKNMQTSANKSLNALLPTTRTRNLTEMLARLAYSSILSGTTDEQDSNASDELIGLLDKISQTGIELQHELKEAKSREIKLLQEVQILRSRMNGYSPKDNNKDGASVTSSGLMKKCQRLEDALLSLQNENLKLNRQLKEGTNMKSTEHSKSKLNRDMEEKFVQTIKENADLLEKVDKMSKEMAAYEKKLQEKADESQLSASDFNKTFLSLKSEKSEVETKLLRKIEDLEKELRAVSGDANDSKNLQLRISEMHRSLLDKDNLILSRENDLKTLCDVNKDLTMKCEDLQKNDVYKRKEVMLLCDKFEKLKTKHKTLETELLKLQSEGQKQSTKKWALEDSLQKVRNENEALHNKMLAEQKQLTMNKLMLEKDYDHLKKKYDGLIAKITKPRQAERTVSSEPCDYSVDTNRVLHKIGASMDLRLNSSRSTKFVDELPDMNISNGPGSSESKNSLGKILWASPVTKVGKNSLGVADAYESSLRSLRRELNHKRRHTVHELHNDEEPIRKSTELNSIRVRSDTDVHYAINFDDSVTAGIPKHFPEDNKVNLNVRPSISSTSIPPAPLQSRIIKHTDLYSTTTVHQTESRFNKTSDSVASPGKSPTKVPSFKQNGSSIKPPCLPPRDVQLQPKVSHHREYLSNMRGVDQVISVQQHSNIVSKIPPRKSKIVSPKANQDSFSNLRSKSEVLTTPQRTHQHRRMHTVPSTTLSRIREKYLVTQDGINYGESPFSREYLSNMEGVRLLVNLSGSSNGNESTIPHRKSLSPAKSILKTSPMLSAGSPSHLVNSEEHVASSKTRLPRNCNISFLASDKRKYGNASINDTKIAADASNEISPNSTASKESFHLSDLPSDQTSIYDKFRNFDSQFSDYKKPPVTIARKQNVTILKDTKPHAGQSTTILTSAKKEVLVRRQHQPQPRRVITVGSQPDDDSADQSSASTTRDHAGRIEFLREIQINTGVQMPALMRDVTQRDDVIVNESDLDNEVRFGLSNNQEAYANKLVKKYINIAKKTSPERK